jgi:hypothetical protein
MDTRLDVAFLPHHSISATSCRTHTFEVTSVRGMAHAKGVIAALGPKQLAAQAA